MIFVTVHEQPFNRLIQKVDELKRDGIIKDDVIIQTGFSTYEPKYCQWSKLIPYQQMVKNVADARIVITHGGPASFIMPLQIGKTPIVVPRQHQYNEHVMTIRSSLQGMWRREWARLFRWKTSIRWEMLSRIMIRSLQVWDMV